MTPPIKARWGALLGRKDFWTTDVPITAALSLLGWGIIHIIGWLAS